MDRVERIRFTMTLPGALVSLKRGMINPKGLPSEKLAYHEQHLTGAEVQNIFHNRVVNLLTVTNSILHLNSNPRQYRLAVACIDAGILPGQENFSIRTGQRYGANLPSEEELLHRVNIRATATGSDKVVIKNGMGDPTVFKVRSAHHDEICGNMAVMEGVKDMEEQVKLYKELTTGENGWDLQLLIRDILKSAFSQANTKFPDQPIFEFDHTLKKQHH